MDIIQILEAVLPDMENYLYGFADLTGLLKGRYLEYTHAIVIGRKLDDSIIDSVKKGPNREYYRLYQDTNAGLSSLALGIYDRLTGIGIASLPISPNIPVSERNSDYEQTLRQDYSHKMAGTRAGLGWIGKTGLFISEKFGPRVRLASVLLKTPLEKTREPINESRCGNCDICVKACPVQAANGKSWNVQVDRDEFLDAFLCRKNCRKLALMSLGKNESHCCICLSACPRGIRL